MAVVIMHVYKYEIRI